MAGFGGFLANFRNDYIDPIFAEGRTRTDFHLNSVSIEYAEEDVSRATRNFDRSLMLGSGTFGSVFKGTMRDGTEVAIKLLQVPEEAGFEEEVAVLSRYRHPNLVILMGFARHHSTGGRTLIYEYLSGGDFSKRLQQSKQKKQPFTARMRLSAALDAASGLSHLHNATPRAFHRDIKSPNILLDKNGTAKMADFGLACVSESSHHKVQQRSGTVGYACQEYIRTGVITEGSEVHSFGMVLLELLTGAPPAVQKADNPNEFVYLTDHLKGSVEKVERMVDKTADFTPGLLHTLANTAFKCIAANPAERPLFVQLVENLRHLLNHTAEVSQAETVANVATDRSPVRQPADSPLNGFERGPDPGELGLVVGQAVQARWKGGLHWYQGRLAQIHADGTVSVQYEDGNREDGIIMRHIRVMEAPPAQGAQGAQVAQVVEDAQPAQIPRELRQQWHSGTEFPKDNADGTVSAGVFQPRSRGRDDMSEVRSEAAGPHCRMLCVFSSCLEASSLQGAAYVVQMTAGRRELSMGRTAQGPEFWDMLVADSQLRSTISREHFKIRLQEDGALPVFFLICGSQNGLLLNGEFIAQGQKERRLQHGDTIALAANVDPAPGLSGKPPPRKPFVAFAFQAMRHGAPLSHWPVCSQAERDLPAPHGTLAGHCWNGETRGVAVPPGEVEVFCLEVHGENVQMQLPAERRQIVYGCPSDGAPLALRIGKGYQSRLWRNVLQPNYHAVGCWDFLAGDHFEIIPWDLGQWSRFKVRALSAAGVVVNHSLCCAVGTERYINSGDTISIDAPSVVSHAGRPSGSSNRGLHFTFRLRQPAIDQPDSTAACVSPVNERPRQLPMLDAETLDEPVPSLITERSNIIAQRSAAGALRAPMSIASETGDEGAGTGTAGQHDPGRGTSDINDRFARTGFR